MTRIALILAAVMCLSGCKSSEIDSAVRNITGDTQPLALAAIEPSSSVEVVSSVEPVACNDYLWRGQWFDCNGNYLRDMD